MKPLTIAFITSRPEPKFEWFCDSLRHQVKGDLIDLIVVDLTTRDPELRLVHGKPVQFVPPKPNVWQGRHRLTKQDFWAKSNALNTAICLCKTEFVCFVDDRCIVKPGFIDAIRTAQRSRYAVFGTYEKRVNMVVESGVITSPGETVTTDHRATWNDGKIFSTFGEHCFGCCIALPLEWCLENNGFDESCDGMRYEDTIFGKMIARNGHKTMFDPSFGVIQDRTPGNPTPLGTDKGESGPNDKSHALLAKVGDSKRATHAIDIRAMRDSVQAGNPFPHHNNVPSFDWFDNELIKDAYVR